MDVAKYTVLAIFAGLLMVGTASALPNYIGLGGFTIYNSTTGAYLTGTYDIIVRVYDDSTGGNQLFQEIHNNTYIRNGTMEILLGNVTPLNLSYSSDYWVSFRFGSNAESSRLRMTSIGYSFRSNETDNVAWNAIYNKPQYIAEGNATGNTTEEIQATINGRYLAIGNKTGNTTAEIQSQIFGLFIAEGNSTGNTTEEIIIAIAGRYLDTGNTTGQGNSTDEIIIAIAGRYLDINNVTGAGNTSAQISAVTGWNRTGNNVSLYYSKDNVSAGSLFISDTGNLGIGTTAPGNKLDIITGATTNSEFHMGETEDNGGYLTSIQDHQFIMSGGAEFVSGSWTARDVSAGIVSINNGDVNFRTDGGLVDGNTFTPTVRMTIKSGGNVGIGTTAPSSSLEISSAGNHLMLTSTHATEGANIELRAPTNGGSNWTIDLQGDGVSNMRFVEIGGGTRLFLEEGGNVGIGTSTPKYRLSVDAANGDVHFNGTNTPVGFFWDESTGNVGIGTTGPSNLVHLSSSDPQLRIEDSDTTAYSLISASGSSGTLKFSADAGNDAPSSRITFFIDGGDELLRIESSGNVGIGTSTPKYRLSVDAANGDVHFNGTNTPVGFFWDESTGRLGLGTTAPATKLSNTGIAILDTGGVGIGGNGLVWFDDVTSGYVAGLVSNRTAGSNGLLIKVANSTATNKNILNLVSGEQSRFIVLNTGNVGIGTTAPGAKLDVAGVARITSTGTPASGTGLEFHYGATADYADIIAYDRTTPGYKTLRLRGDKILLSNGNVGIGTTAPLKKLSVNGDVNISGTLLMDNGIMVTVNGTKDIGNTTNWFNAVYSERYYGKIDCGMIDGGSDSDFCADATGSGSGVNMWVDNGTSLSPNVTYAANVNLSEGGIDALYVTEMGRRVATMDKGSGWTNTSTVVKLANGSNRVCLNCDSPRGKLDVAGTSYFNESIYLDDNTGTSPSINILDGSNEYSQIFKIDSSHVYNTIIGENSDSWVYYLSDSDEVGSTNDYSSFQFALENNDSEIYFGSDIRWTLRNSLNGFEDMDLSFWTAENGGSRAERMIIQSNGDIIMNGSNSPQGFFFDESTGNVGIGTTAPGSELHVVAGSGNSVIYIDSPTGADAGIDLRENNVEKWYVYNDASDSDKLKFYSGGVKVTIQSNGNVGIGTVNPDEKLTVNGNLNLSGILKIEGNINPMTNATYNASNATNWYDYVYAKNFVGKLNCKDITGSPDSDFCTDATGASSGVNMWVDNGTYLTPNVSYANNLNISEGWIDSTEIYKKGLGLGAYYLGIGNQSSGNTTAEIQAVIFGKFIAEGNATGNTSDEIHAEIYGKFIAVGNETYFGGNTTEQIQAANNGRFLSVGNATLWQPKGANTSTWGMEPIANTTYSLGNITNWYDDLYIDNIHATDIEVKNNITARLDVDVKGNVHIDDNKKYIVGTDNDGSMYWNGTCTIITGGSSTLSLC